MSPVTSLKPRLQSHWGCLPADAGGATQPVAMTSPQGRPGGREAGMLEERGVAIQTGSLRRRGGEAETPPRHPQVPPCTTRCDKGQTASLFRALVTRCVCVCVCVHMLVVLYLPPTLEWIYLSGMCRFIRVGLFFLLLNYLLNDHLFWSQGFCPGQSEVLMMSSSPPLSP